MGTRGTIRIRYGARCITFYNHYDSYPSGLGVKFLTSIKTLIDKYGLEGFIAKIKALKIVTEYDIPTDEDKTNLAPYTDIGVGSQTTDDWYCLTRKMQGNIESIIESGYGYDMSGSIGYEEYNYFLNIDTLTVGYTWDDNPIDKQTSITEIDTLIASWTR